MGGVSERGIRPSPNMMFCSLLRVSPTTCSPFPLVDCTTYTLIYTFCILLCEYIKQQSVASEVRPKQTREESEPRDGIHRGGQGGRAANVW